jgi:hypothetical protein
MDNKGRRVKVVGVRPDGKPSLVDVETGEAIQ